jgi:hypothetical protein
LPTGQSILVQQGVYYAVTAMVDVSSAQIQQIATNYGLSLIAATYDDNYDPQNATPVLPAAKSGYRYVAGQLVGVSSGKTVPWSVPSPWSLFDSSTIVAAWAGLPQGSPQTLPTVSCPAPATPWGAMLAAAVGGVAIFQAGRWILRKA